MIRRLAAVFGFSVLAATAQEATHTGHIPFAPGGTIRIDNSYGYLTVEGWDEPEVEVTVNKQGAAPLDRVHVSTERRPDGEVAISTQPARRKLLIVTWPRPRKHGITTEYIIHVPRDSRLEIHHDNGYIWVSDVAGEIAVHSHTGDMIVMLPDPGAYAIAARTRLGSVSSDFAGKGHYSFLAGMHFDYASPAAKRHVDLRMGRGCITILNGPASGSFWKDSPKSYLCEWCGSGGASAAGESADKSAAKR